MVAEDQLAAAKAAALQNLATSTSDKASVQNGHPKKESRKSRRRKKKRDPKEQHNAGIIQQSLDKSDQNETEYIHEKLSIETLEQDDQADTPMAEILAAMKRFSQRVGSTYDQGDDKYDQEAGTEIAKEIDDTATGKKQASTRNRDELGSDSEMDNEGLDQPKQTSNEPLPRKRLKELRRRFISVLKTHCEQPQVVDSWDVNSSDPFLLVRMKTWPNSVVVPSIWRMKRKYLQNKRGMEKRPFELPAYIAETGVGALRDAQIEADEKKTMKQKQREKMRAKTGKGIEIDPTRLHDAFFKFQSKPRLTPHGDLYYELRELEANGTNFQPGVISEELRAALGMKKDDPPPWLVSMQRFGPPPGYPGLRIPGLNCPIPPGAAFGYQESGWGKVPVNVHGIPLYGDVFEQGLQFEDKDERFDWNATKKEKRWGEMENVTSNNLEGLDEKKDSEGSDEEEKEVRRRAKRLRDEGSEKKTSERVERKGPARNQLYEILESRRISVGENTKFGSNYAYNMRESRENETDTKERSGEKRRRQEENEQQDERSKKRREFKF